MHPDDIDRLVTDDRPLGSGISPDRLGSWTPIYTGSPTFPNPPMYTAVYQCEINKINPEKHCTNTATPWMFIHTIEMFPGPKSARVCQACRDAEFERPLEERRYYHSAPSRPLD